MESTRSGESAEAAVESLLAASSNRSLNVRSFRPGDIKSREFLYGWTDLAAVLGKLRSPTDVSPC